MIKNAAYDTRRGYLLLNTKDIDNANGMVLLLLLIPRIHYFLPFHFVLARPFQSSHQAITPAVLP